MSNPTFLVYFYPWLKKKHRIEKLQQTLARDDFQEQKRDEQLEHRKK
jgi:hypothetical protein